MRVERFEELDCWKEARKLRNMISHVFRSHTVGREVILRNQIKSAALSIMANIAEGFESGTNRENIVFLTYARRSCGEVRSHLYAALDDGLVSKSDFEEIYSQSVRTGKLITNFIAYLRQCDHQKHPVSRRSSVECKL
jgi:four helix bundle protein